MSGPVLREVLAPGDPAIVSGHALLRDTFLKAEIVDRTEWRNLLRERVAGVWSDTRWHLVVAERGGRVIGVATGTYLGNVNTGLIGYLAVSAAARGLGLGPLLRARLRTLFRRDAREVHGQPLQAVIGEVRSDNPWLRTLVRRERVLCLDFGYVQPTLRRGSRSVPLVLYYESLDRPRRRLPASLIRQLLFTTWRRVYRIARPMSRVPFRRMLRELEGRRSVGSLTLDDLPAQGKTHHR